MSQAATTTARSPSRNLGIAAVVFATVSWGLMPLIVKNVEMPILAFTSWRLIFGVVIYGVALLVTGRRLTREDLKRSAPGGLAFGLDISLTFSALSLTSVANATIIAALAPVVITLGAVRWFGERIGRREVFCMVLAFAGVTAVAIGSAGSPSFSPLGDALAAASIFSWSAFWLASKRAREHVGALEYVASMQIVAAVAVTFVTFVARVPLTFPHGADLGWVLLMVLIPGAAAHLAVAWAHLHVEAWLSALITQCMPVVGSTAAWILLGESLSPITIIGGLVVLASTATIVVWTTRSAEGSGAAPFDEPPLIPDPTG